MSEPRLTLVGEAPGGHGSEFEPALEGLVGRRLAKMMELTPEDYERLTRRLNLFETPDAGKRWDATEAHLRALRMAGGFADGERVVLLGGRVAKAFCADVLERYRWYSVVSLVTGRTWWYARAPHPSGRNRLLNDSDERTRMARFLREAVRDRA